VAIAKLAELSAGLRKSAAGFRLPGALAPGSATGSFPRPEDPRAATTTSTSAVRPVAAVRGS
jgi:hypothetical protein